MLEMVDSLLAELVSGGLVRVTAGGCVNVARLGPDVGICVRVVRSMRSAWRHLGQRRPEWVTIRCWLACAGRFVVDGRGSAWLWGVSGVLLVPSRPHGG